MKKNYRLFFAVMLLGMITTGAIFGFKHYQKQESFFESEVEENEEEEEGAPREYWDDMMKDPATGEVPHDRLLTAFQYMKQKQNTMSKAAIPGVVWEERGPNNIAGIAMTLLVDANDRTKKTIWTGGGGGLWKTTDITQAAPNWTIVNEIAPGFGVTGIVQGSDTPQIMYCATGMYYWGQRGAGVYKSTNKGTTWTQLSATNNSNFYFCNKIFAINSMTLLVATTTGLYRSTNGGTSFTKVLGNGTSGATSNIAWDIDRATNGTLYATVEGTIHKSFDNGQTWGTPLTLPPFPVAVTEVALAPSDTNYVYVYSTNLEPLVFFKSTNAGSSFTNQSMPPSLTSRGKTLIVHPTNPQEIILGNGDLYKTTNGGVSWSNISSTVVHSDQRFGVYAPGTSYLAYFCTDGGVYQSDDVNASAPTFTGKYANNRTLQFYTCAIPPDEGSNNFLAAAQDNGTHEFSAAGLGATRKLMGGDGFDCHINQREPQYQWYSSQKGNINISRNFGTTSSSYKTVFGAPFATRFVVDEQYKKVYCTTYSRTGSSSTWRDIIRIDNDSQYNITDTSVIRITQIDAQPTALKISPNIPGRIYIGCNNGRLVRLDNAHALSGGTYLSPLSTSGVIMNSGWGMNGTISCIEVDPASELHILVTMSNYGVTSVWETTNAGSTWKSIEGNLPDIPVWSIVFNPSNSNQALIGTELGVWSTDNLNGAFTDWQPTNSGLANVRVTMLKTRPSDNLVIAATYGRGLFSSDVFSYASFVTNRETNYNVFYMGQPVQFTNTSKAGSYLWDFGDGTTSTQKNPTKYYLSPGTYNVRLTINGGTKTFTPTHPIVVLPMRGTPYSLADGGNFETNPTDFAAVTVSGTPFQRGNSTITNKNGTQSGSYAWVTGLYETGYQPNTVSYLYTPCFSFSVNYQFHPPPEPKFFAKYHFPTNPDGFRVEYTEDTGATWKPLGTGTAPAWYNFANAAGALFPVNNAYFTGSNTSGFSMLRFSPSSPADEIRFKPVIGFRFVMKSDHINNGAGLAIDDFCILDVDSSPPVPYEHVEFDLTEKTTTTGHAIQLNSTAELATSYRWNFGDGTVSTLANPLKTYNNPGVYIISVTINDKGNNPLCTKKDTIVVVKGRALPYTLANGGDFETNSSDFVPYSPLDNSFVRGNFEWIYPYAGANAWSAYTETPHSGEFPEKLETYLYTPCFNFSATTAYTISFNLYAAFWWSEAIYTSNPGLRMEYSFDGNSWQPLGTTVQTNWYNYSNSTGVVRFPINEACFKNEGYGLKTYSSSTLNNHSKVFFRFVTRDAGIGGGVGSGSFIIDNFTITGPAANAPSAAPIYASNSIPTGNHKHTFITNLIPSANLANMYYLNGPNQIQLSVSVMAANGQLIKKQTVSIGELLDLSDVSAGIYYCMFTTADGLKQMEKVVVR